MQAGGEARTGTRARMASDVRAVVARFSSWIALFAVQSGIRHASHRPNRGSSIRLTPALPAAALAANVTRASDASDVTAL